MKKATLTGRQVVAAIFAGIFGHVLFAIGWLGLGIAVLGGLLFALLGGSIEGLIGSFIEPGTVSEVFTSAGGVVSGVAIGLGIGALVFILLGYFISAGILRGGHVRRPWATSLSAIAIVAVLDVPLLFVYASIASGDGRPGFLLVTVLGTIIIGILVWLWMTWGHRGPASEFAGKSVTGSGTATAVESSDTPPAVEAPAEAEVVEPEPVVVKPARKPAAKKTPPTA